MILTDLDALAAVLAAAIKPDRTINFEGTLYRAVPAEIADAISFLIEAARREAALREALEAMVMTWFAYSDNAGRKDVLVRLAELDTFHTTVNAARSLLSADDLVLDGDPLAPADPDE